jgi:uncharacterized hydrophobic protein (TIGR00271 family)
MKTLYGTIPREPIWRVLVLLEMREAHQLGWLLGLHLARANHGALLGAIMEPPGTAGDSEAVSLAAACLSDLRTRAGPEDRIAELVFSSRNPSQDIAQLVKTADIDLVIADSDHYERFGLESLSCTLAILRSRPDVGAAVQAAGFQRILVPTAGGNHSAVALGILKNLPPQIGIDALYISRNEQGPSGEALGRNNLNRVLSWSQADQRVNPLVKRHDSAAVGIVTQSAQGYDLVVLGESNEGSLEKAIFGTVVDQVVHDSLTPVLVVRQARSSFTGTLLNRLDWMVHRIIPTVNARERDDIYVKVYAGARPTLSYYVLITLSAAIAGLGLILNSPAVVIGAMLVAPLMSPIMAAGMALMLGDTHSLRSSLGGVIRGAIIAIIVGVVLGLKPGDDLTSEVLARTQPTLLDLGVALFSGLAGAYALSFLDAAGALPGVAIAAALVPPLASVGIAWAERDWAKGFGALLLFLTNLVAISSAAALVFGAIGFRPNPTEKHRRVIQARSVRMAVASLVLVTAILTFATVQLSRTNTRQLTINNVTISQVQAVLGEGASLDGPPVIRSSSNPLQMEITVRSPGTPSGFKIQELQEAIALSLQEKLGLSGDVQLTLTHIRTTTVDEFAIPTPIPTPETDSADAPETGLLPTETPLPTATVTPLPTLTPTLTATPLPTDTPVPTETPTATPIPSPTPVMRSVTSPWGLNLRATPGETGRIVLLLPANSQVLLLENSSVDAQGRLWQEVTFGTNSGWALDEFLR